MNSPEPALRVSQASLLWFGQRRPRGRRCRRPGKFRRELFFPESAETPGPQAIAILCSSLAAIEDGDRNGGRDHFKYCVRAGDVALRARFGGARLRRVLVVRRGYCRGHSPQSSSGTVGRRLEGLLN
jgi:hypothetical protein